MRTPIPETGDQRAIFNAARVLGLLLSFQDMQANLVKNLGPMWWWKVRDLQDSLNGILDKTCGGNRTTEPPAIDYGSTDAGWVFKMGREILPEEQRLFTMIAKAFGAWHPATDDLARLILSRPTGQAADWNEGAEPNRKSQHDRDSEELRRLCGERDTARRERDEARAQLAKLMAQQASKAIQGAPALLFGIDPGSKDEMTVQTISGLRPIRTDFEASWGADPCPGCEKGATCNKADCGRLKLPEGHPYRTLDSATPEAKEVWRKFWVWSVCRAGTPDLGLIMNELADYHALLQEVPKVYMHVTGQRVSKPNTLASVVISLADERLNEAITENEAEVREEYRQAATPEPEAEPIKYKPGEWYEAKDRDDLEAFFRSRLPAIREAAREHGYAIGLHGSMRRDLDLIAVPWREGASDKDVLAHAIAMAACGITRDGPYQWEQKPLGRFAASLSCCWPRWFNEAGAGHIDLSVVDPTRPAPIGPDAQPNGMANKWCWWLGDEEQFKFADSESEAHGEAQSRIDGGCDPGQTHQYSVARVQHPIDALGMDWLALHVAESIAENVCCWCDDNTGAEEPSIMLSPDDSKALGLMVANFLRQRVSVDWWTADQKTVTVHTYVSGSNESEAASDHQEKEGQQ